MCVGSLRAPTGAKKSLTCVAEQRFATSLFKKGRCFIVVVLFSLGFSQVI